MLLLPVLFCRVSQAWNPHLLQLSPGTWSLWQSHASVHLLWSLCWCHWCIVCHQLGLLDTDLHALGNGGFVETSHMTNFASSSSCHAKPLMSSAKWRLVIVLPPVLTVPWWLSKASAMILSRNMLKRVGESRHSYWTPAVLRNQSPMLLLKRTALVALS